MIPHTETYEASSGFLKDFRMGVLLQWTFDTTSIPWDSFNTCIVSYLPYI
jgi:hypothetical protein